MVTTSKYLLQLHILLVAPQVDKSHLYTFSNQQHNSSYPCTPLTPFFAENIVTIIFIFLIVTQNPLVSMPSFHFLSFSNSFHILSAISTRSSELTQQCFKYQCGFLINTNLYHKLLTKCTIDSNKTSCILVQSAQHLQPTLHRIVHCPPHYILWYPVKCILQVNKSTTTLCSHQN